MRKPPADAGTVTLVAYDIAPIGGMERAAFELACGLLERGHKLVVIARRCDLPAGPNLRFVRIPGPARPAALATFMFAVLGSIAVWRRRVGYLHTVGAVVLPRADAITVQFCFRAFADHGLSRASRSSRLYRLNDRMTTLIGTALEHWCYARRPARMLITVSAGVGRELRRHYGVLDGTLRVIPNGVDSATFRPDDAARERVRGQLQTGEDPLAVFVGGDWERKGLAHTIEALADAARWRLVVVGRGDTERYRALAERAGVLDRVSFVGHQADPKPYYAAADAFVLPTAYEAHPLVALEAAAHGLPILGTSTNGLEDLIQDGENGWYVERSGKSIAACLGRIEIDESRRLAMGAAARASVSELDWKRIVTDYEAAYMELDPA
ncbi:MAG TPA: glycosyltransferase family 4 protein [Solirubrobacteraceae bacterium]